MNIDFNNKNIFITGAARGIGSGIKAEFVANGANVICPTRDELDLASSESVANYLKLHEGDFSDINNSFDVLVFCAGVNNVAPADEITKEMMEDTFQVNLFSSMEIIKAALPYMKEKKDGRIIFISSLYSMVTREGRLPYTSAKHAITGMVKTLALELAPYGIYVNAVAPGYVMTDMTKQNLTDEDISKIKESIPTGEFQKVEDIAGAVTFFASPLSNNITGQTLYVDGGFLLR